MTRDRSPVPDVLARPRTLAGCALAMTSLALLVGCGRGEDTPTASAVISVDTLPSGTQVLRHELPPDRFEEEGWSIRQDLRLGTIAGGGPTQFGDLRDLAVDGQGRIYALDTGAAEVRVFGPDGEHLRTLGRKGEGPGEFRGANGVAIGPRGNVWVVDPRAGRFTVFTPDGELISSHDVVFLSRGFVWDGTIDGQGRPVDGRGLIFEPPDTRESFTRRLDLGAGTVDSLFRPRPPAGWTARVFVFERSGSRRLQAVPHAGRFVYRHDGEDGVWSAVTDRYRLYHHDLAGDTLRIVEGELAPVPVPQREREAVEESFVENRRWAAETEGELSWIPDHKAPVLGLSVDDRGRLWVRLATNEEGSARFDVYGPDGRWIGAAQSDFEFPTYVRTVIRDGRFYAIAQDSLDIRYVVRGRIHVP